MALRFLSARRRLAGLAAVATLGAMVAVLAGSQQSASGATETIYLPATGSVTVQGHGNGHGHGMSQYGAQGAALRGLTAAQIVGFYYPGTTLVKDNNPQITVSISGTSASQTTVSGVTGISGSAAAKLVATTKYVLVPSGSGFQLQSGGKAVAGVPTLPSPAYFTTSATTIRLYYTDGTSGDYRGVLGAARNGSGLVTVNKVSLDQYVQGVVPRESPSYWEPAALGAQAIAARSYALYGIQHAGNGLYDICDTDSCQVYGGYAQNNAAGTRLYGEQASTNAAVAATSGQVLQYGGSAVFAQFSASNGGWTVDGGQPYLAAEADPYDNVASGDPYLSWTNTVPVTQIAAGYGLQSVSSIQITQRDGNGDWGGRVIQANVIGLDSAGRPQVVATTGYTLQRVLGLPENWFRIMPAPAINTVGGSAISPTPTSVEFFTRTSANQLTARMYVNGSGWQGVQDLGAPAGTTLAWDPDAATWGDGHVDVVSADAAHNLAIRSYTPGSGWGAWQSKPWPMVSSPSAVSAYPNEVDIFYRGTNGTLVTARWSKAGGWVGPMAVAGVANMASGPDAMAAVETNHAVTVTYRGTDRLLYTVTRTNGAWGTASIANPARGLPVPAAALDPSIGDSGNGAPSVSYTATNGTIYHANYDPGTQLWGPWYAIPGGTATSAPDVANHGSTHVDVIAGTNGVLQTQSWNAGVGWRTWISLP